MIKIDNPIELNMDFAEGRMEENVGSRGNK